MIKFVFTHLFDKDVWSTYYMPSIVLDPRDTMAARPAPSSREPTFLWENSKLVNHEEIVYLQLVTKC